MGRPAKKTKKVPLNLTMEPELRDWAVAYAYVKNESLSEMVARLLKQEVADHCAKKKPPKTRHHHGAGPAIPLHRSA
jgi:hypothetical protein